MAYSGTCIHIATEVLETLHPGVTGLCIMIKVWLVTLIELTNSLNTRDDEKCSLEPRLSVLDFVRSFGEKSGARQNSVKNSDHFDVLCVLIACMVLEIINQNQMSKNQKSSLIVWNTVLKSKCSCACWLVSIHVQKNAPPSGFNFSISNFLTVV